MTRLHSDSKKTDGSVFIGWVALLFCCVVLSTAAKAEPPKFQSAYVLPVEGPIEPMLGEFFRRRIDELRDSRPELLVLEIDSPGGFLSTMDEMIKQLDALTGVTKVAYVKREALSAAAILALACDQIILAPEARFGDAGPLVLGDDAAFRYVDAKTRSDLVARVRILADRHGRPAALAEAMVDKDSVVFQAIETKTGRKAYFTEAEWEAFSAKAEWELGLMVLESRNDLFLEVTGTRAVALGLADHLANSTTEALTTVGFQGTPIQFEHTWVDGLVTILASPFVTVLLVVAGIIGLVVELAAPGIGLGGLTSLLCFGLFFWSRFLGGTAGWLEVLLLLIGCLFLAVEIFLLPGVGVAGVTGVGLVALSLLMAMRHSLLPESNRDLSQLGNQLLTLLACFVALIGAGLIWGKHLANLPMIRRLTLIPNESLASVEGIRTAMDEIERPIASRSIQDLGSNEIGRADSALRPGGRARFGDLLVDVTSEGDFVDAGTPIQIVSRIGSRVLVRRM